MRTSVTLAIIISLFLSTAPVSAAVTTSSTKATTVTSTTASSTLCTTLTKTLKYKTSKDSNTKGEVSKLQNFFKAQGLYTATPNGIFGSLTLKTVKSFQKKHGLKVTGQVDSKTRARIRQLSCGAGGSTRTGTKTTKTSTAETEKEKTTKTTTSSKGGGGSGSSSSGDATSIPAVTPVPATTTASGIPIVSQFKNKKVVGRINAQSGDVIEDVHIISDEGPCIYIGNGVSNVTIRNSEIGPCKNPTALQSTKGIYHSGIFAVDNSTNITVRQNVIHDVNIGIYFYKGLHPIYVDHNYFYNIQGPFPAGKSVGIDWVTTGTAGSKIMCNVSDMEDMIYPANATSSKWGVEDHISFWHSMGLPDANRTEVAYNRIRGGISKSGSGMLLADGGGGNYWSHDNTIVNVGGVGSGIATGENGTIENNRIFSDGVTNLFSGAGIYVHNYYPGTVCKNNTIKNNKVYTWNRAWYNPAIIENYGNNGTCNEGLVVSGNSFNSSTGYYKSPEDSTLNAAMFDQEYVSECKMESFLLSHGTTPPLVVLPTSSRVLGASTDTPQCIQLEQNLHRGMESLQVSLLQNFLYQQGFLEVLATGFFGDKTVNAVKEYQASNSIKQTGMVYELTRKSITKQSCQ